MGAVSSRCLPGFYTKLNVWGSLGLNFDYDGGPIIENGVPSFYTLRILEGSTSTSFCEGIRTGLSCQAGAAKHGIFEKNFGAGFLDDSDFSESEQLLEDGSWSVSAFVLQKKFLRSLCSNILAAVYF